MSNADYITNQDIMLLLAKRIKEYRLAARMSQKEMAEKSGVSLATISHFEQGVNQNMTLNNFISLLRIIGMEQRVSDLLPELPMPPLALKQINKLSMLIILTSAKTMTGTSKIKAPARTMPRFAQEANEIALNMAQFLSLIHI